MSRFVRPDTATLTISGGDTLTVKRRLTAGDDRIRRGMTSFVTLGDLALVVAYLLDWTLTNDDGERVKIKGLSTQELVDQLDALDADDFAEIHAAIAAHVTAMQAERDAEKNAKDGATSSSAISPSLVGSAGASSGSAT